MSLTPDHRHAYRRWLIEHDLQPEVVDAILETMPPFDWSNIARRDEVATKDELRALDQRVGRVELRLEGVEQRLDAVDDRLGRVERHVERLDGRMVVMNDSLNGRIDTLYNAMLWGFATMILGFVAVISAIFVAV